MKYTYTSLNRTAQDLDGFLNDDNRVIIEVMPVSDFTVLIKWRELNALERLNNDK